MKKILLVILVLFLCTACGNSKELDDYPELNKEVNDFIETLKESDSFADISYDSTNVINLEGEKAYDVLYVTNCSKFIMSFDEKFELAWIALNKEELCSKNVGFSKDIFKNQVDTLLTLERYNINEDKFPGITGDTYDDYNEYMFGNNDKEYILTNDELYIFYIPDTSFSIVGYTD